VFTQGKRNPQGLTRKENTKSISLRVTDYGASDAAVVGFC